MADLARLYDFVAGTVIDSEQVDAEFNQLIARINALEPDSLNTTLAELLGISQTGTARRAKSITAGSVAITTTPAYIDSVSVSVPQDALVMLCYRARGVGNGIATASVLVHVDGAQLPGFEGAAGVPVGIGNFTPQATYTYVVSDPSAAPAGGPASGFGASALVPTNPPVAQSAAAKGVIPLELTAGAHTIQIQATASANGVISMDNRHLRAFVVGF